MLLFPAGRSECAGTDGETDRDAHQRQARHRFHQTLRSSHWWVVVVVVVLFLFLYYFYFYFNAVLNHRS